MTLQAVFWDFDGVVLDSVHVKTRAFARMFSQYGPEIEQAVVEYHLAHGGISRYEKFRYYHSQLLNAPVSEEQIQSLGERFSELALAEVLAAPFIPGAFETLTSLLERGIPAYVVSGTPEEEVRLIVRERQLGGFFAEVHGSPRKKAPIMNEILGRKRYDAARCLFLGDAMTDYDAAVATGVPFLGVGSGGADSCFPQGTTVLERVDLKEWMI